MSTEDEVVLLGHAHIDLAWLWTKDETIHLVSLGTFNYTLKLMEEFPFLKFAQSSAQIYKWIEQYYPEVFRKIVEKTKEGQWEIVGGSWSEFSPNLTNEETLIRQYLYGKLYFKEKFGIDVKVAWLPDSFGFPWTLPQVLKKSGIEYFLTSKLNWQIERMKKPIPFPFYIFFWEAPEGSRILSMLTPGGYNGLIKKENIQDQILRLKEKHGVNKLLYLFGYGDHGGGPTKHMVNEALRVKESESSLEVSFGSALDFFRDLSSSLPEEKIPSYKDELYLKTHRGTFTTESRMKKILTELEVLIRYAEMLSTFNYMLLNEDYPKKELRKIWENVLYFTTHDIADGTSIEDVYEEIFQDEYPKIKEDINTMIKNAMDNLIERRENGKEEYIVVFNSSLWERTGVARLQLNSYLKDNVEIVDTSNTPLKSQELYENGKTSVVFLARNVPPLGYKIFRVSKKTKNKDETRIKVGHWFLENEFLRVEIDSSSGLVSRLFDKKNGVEVLSNTSKGNALLLYEDEPPNAPAGEPAWNLYLGEKVELSKLDSINIASSGPFFASIRVTRSYGNSKFIQDVVLYDGVPYVEFTTRVFWEEKYKTLKVSFPLSFSDDYATYGIQFGVIQRFRHDLTSSKKELMFPKRSWEESDVAKFEVPAQRWMNVDKEDKSYGVALISKDRYGFSYECNEIKITLLRSPRRGYPQQPESWVDQSSDEKVGEHVFKYILYPHRGSWEAAKIPMLAFEYVNELLVNYFKGERKEPEAFSLIEFSSSREPILTSLKLSESNDSIILRFYNPYPDEIELRIRPSFNMASAEEVDLLEEGNYLKIPLNIEKDEIKIKTKNFEIKTIKIRKK